MTVFYIFITISVCFCPFTEINKISKRCKASLKTKNKEMTQGRKKKLNEFSQLYCFSLYFSFILFWFILFYFLDESDIFVVSDGYIHTHTTVCMYLDVYPNPNLPKNHSHWFFSNGNLQKADEIAGKVPATPADSNLTISTVQCFLTKKRLKLYFCYSHVVTKWISQIKKRTS